MDRQEMLKTLTTARVVLKEGGNLVLSAALGEIADQLSEPVQAERPHNQFYYHFAFSWNNKIADITITTPSALVGLPQLAQVNDFIRQQVGAEPGTLAIIGIHLVGSAYVSPLIVPGQILTLPGQ